jgi:hypothetical protein
LPGLAERFVGAPGNERGITFAELEENALDPAEFIAATLNMYCAPLERPSTTTDVAVDGGWANSVQFKPESSE